MDPFIARTMVESLSKGINPVTGRALSQNDICTNEDVQDALLEVLDHCSIESTEQYLVRIREEKREKLNQSVNETQSDILEGVNFGQKRRKHTYFLCTDLVVIFIK